MDENTVPQLQALDDSWSVYGIPVKAAGVPFSVVARFVEQFRREENGCWIWTGRTDGREDSNSHGYGLFQFKGQQSAHRFSYFLFNGSWPKYQTHHKCHHKPCVHPEHLQSLTPSGHAQAHAIPRTTCLIGHPWIPENWLVSKEGNKQCRLCFESTRAEWVAKARENGYVSVPRKTHCLRGHELSPENVSLGTLGARNCRICAREWHKLNPTPKPRSIRGPRPRGTKTHCVHGHEYVESNKYFYKSGVFVCLTCRNDRNKAYIRNPKLKPHDPLSPAPPEPPAA